MSVQIPLPPAVPAIAQHRPAGAGYSPRVLLGQAPQEPAQLPQVDVAVEVVGNLPLELKIQDISRLLTRRQQTRSATRVYPPTILELITLVNRNPEKPRGKAWTSIMGLSMRYDARTAMVTVEYCVDYCGFDRSTGAFETKRRMVSYRAPEKAVVAKVNKKLDDLRKYAAR